MADPVLIDRIDKVKDLIALVIELLKKRRRGNNLLALTGNEVDLVLAFLHGGDIVVEGAEVARGSGGVEAEEFRDALAVGGVVEHAELEVDAELVVELIVLFLVVLGEGLDHGEDLADEFLLDGLEDLGLLEDLTRDVEGEVLGVDDALDEGEVLWDEEVKVIGDEDALDKELEASGDLGVLRVEDGGVEVGGDVEDGAELEVSFCGEVGPAEGVVGLVKGALEEGLVLVV
mmetsp:Transcript_31131/g.52449  ORF Transcript_31131/g.52449 Transcript_31131/m.52449 type:complete len:231 (-) Transcript_31131:897-1589(-)